MTTEAVPTKRKRGRPPGSGAGPTGRAKVPLTLRIPKQLRTQLDRLAAERGADRTAIVIDLLSKGLEG